MLKNAKVAFSFSVKDLAAAKEFYADKLGLPVDSDSYPGTLIMNLQDDHQVLVYERPAYEPAAYTLLNFTVDDLAKTMDDLTAKGVKFEHYDLPDCKTDEHGVATYGTMKIAFFNDPPGNNHAIMQMS